MRGIISFFKLSLLFAALSALLIIVGYLFGGRGGAITFFLFSLVMNLGSYWFSDKIALSMSRARQVDENQYPQLYQDVRELTQAMNIPMPRVYISDQMQPNAFATGRNPKHSAVCFTKGIMEFLHREELKGVLAHELAHIKNRDVLISTVAAVFASAISSLTNIFMFFGGSGDDEAPNPLAQLAVLIFAPLTATIIQLAISRSREYFADATGAEYSKNPEALANALLKIERYAHHVPMNVNPALSSLWISNPFKNGGFMMTLFSTHPSTQERVRRLREMTQ